MKVFHQYCQNKKQQSSQALAYVLYFETCSYYQHGCFPNFSGGRNLSFSSLQEIETIVVPANSYDTLPTVPSREKIKKLSTAAGRAEYIGLCLPVDVTMMFQVSIVLHYSGMITFKYDTYISFVSNSRTPEILLDFIPVILPDIKVMQHDSYWSIWSEVKTKSMPSHAHPHRATILHHLCMSGFKPQLCFIYQ